MKLRHKIYEIADSTGALINLENEKDVRMVYDDIVTEVLLTDAFKKVYHDEGELEGFSPLQYSSNANGTFIEDGNLVLEGKRIHLYVPEKDIHVFFTKVRNPAIAAPAVTISTQYLLGVSKLLQVIDGEALYGADLNSEEKEALNKQKEEELLAIASAPPVEALEESTPVAEYGTEITGNTEVTESGTTPEGEIPAEVTSETSQNVTGENLGGQTEVPVAGSETPVEEVTTPVAEEVTPVVEEVIPVVETPIVEEPIVEVPVVETPVAIIEEVVPVVEVPVTPQVSEVPVVQPVAEVIPEVKEEPVEEKEEVTLNAKEYQDARRFFGKEPRVSTSVRRDDALQRHSGQPGERLFISHPG